MNTLLIIAPPSDSHVVWMSKLCARLSLTVFIFVFVALHLLWVCCV